MSMEHQIDSLTIFKLFIGLILSWKITNNSGSISFLVCINAFGKELNAMDALYREDVTCISSYVVPTLREQASSACKDSICWRILCISSDIGFLLTWIEFYYMRIVPCQKE